ncbi:MAG TPA: HEPN domain-containing protein [Rhizomicrobium sp.]
MKAQTARALARARAALEKAQKLLSLEMFDIAGRQAYIASLTAARALAFEQTGKAPKTHKGVKSIMHQMVRQGLPIERSLLVVLEYGFELKNTADYGEAERIQMADAERVCQLASGFIERIEQLISPQG